METTRGSEFVCERCESRRHYEEWVPLHGPRPEPNHSIKVVRCGDCGLARPLGPWLAGSSDSMRPPLAC
jgi:hypothetical protein